MIKNLTILIIFIISSFLFFYSFIKSTEAEEQAILAREKYSSIKQAEQKADSLKLQLEEMKIQLEECKQNRNGLENE